VKGFLSARFSGELLHSCKECFVGSIPISGLRPGALDAKPLLAAIIGADNLILFDDILQQRVTSKPMGARKSVQVQLLSVVRNYRSGGTGRHTHQ